MTFEIHRERPEWSQCTCGGLKVSRTRFISKGGASFGLAVIEYAPHTSGEVWILIALGREGDRDGFWCRVRKEERGFVTALGNALESPWRGDAALARMLSRDDALAHPRKAEVFELIDLLVDREPAIASFFRRQACGDANAPDEQRFQLPDDVTRSARADIQDDFIVLDDRFFIRCMVPFAVENRSTWNVATWLEVNRTVAERFVAVWSDPVAYGALRFSGTIANDFGPLSIPISVGAKVEAHVVQANFLPYVKSGEGVSEFISNPWPAAAFERYAVEHDLL